MSQPIPPEHLAELSAAGTDLAAARQARAELQARHQAELAQAVATEGAHQARVDAAYQVIGAAMQPGETRLLIPLEAPGIYKSKDGEISVGPVHSIFPNPKVADPVQ